MVRYDSIGIAFTRRAREERKRGAWPYLAVDGRDGSEVMVQKAANFEAEITQAGADEGLINSSR